MEGFKLPESLESLERRLIELLKQKGPEENAEVRELLDTWTQSQEKIAESADDFKLAQIEMNLNRARLYFKAGYLAESFENFEDARRQALQESRTGLYGEIMEEMNALGL